jgi:hypothetical protein
MTADTGTKPTFLSRKVPHQIVRLVPFAYGWIQRGLYVPTSSRSPRSECQLTARPGRRRAEETVFPVPPLCGGACFVLDHQKISLASVDSDKMAHQLSRHRECRPVRRRTACANSTTSYDRVAHLPHAFPQSLLQRIGGSLPRQAQQTLPDSRLGSSPGA